MLAGLTTRVKNADEIEHLMAEYEMLHPEITEMKEQQVQFIGPPNIGGGQLDNQTKYVLVPAVRKVTDELRKILQLLGPTYEKYYS